MLTNSFAGDQNNVTNLIGNDEPNRGQIPADNTQLKNDTRGNENSVKEVSPLDSCKIKTKRNNHKAFKVKRTVYTNTQKNFINASNNLKKSYETIKRNQTNLSSDPQLEEEELDITVKNIIEQVFGIKFPNTSLKKQRKQFVSNYVVPEPPLSLDIDDCTSGYRKLDSVIKEAFEDVWKHMSDISEINTKYRFWLQNIIELDEFCEYDVREYLIRNMFNEKERVERLQYELDDFHNDIQLRLMAIINEVVEILVHKQCATTERHDNVINNKNNDQREESEENAGGNVQTIIEERKRGINMKIKMLEMENEKLRNDEFDYYTQTQTLLKELTFRNKNLENIKECIASLSNEKADLISTIEKTEIEKEGIRTIQHQIETEREKNKHLRDLIAKKYEK